jgi:ketosteroid isomerase-like protein
LVAGAAVSRLTPEQAETFARSWVAAWNAHALDAILEHYADDVVFTSPFATELVGSDTIHGRAALRAYFAAALDRFPDLAFSQPRVVVGATSVCLLYRSVRDLDAAETLVFDDEGRVVRVYAHYARAD